MSHKFSVKPASFLLSLGVVAAFALVTPIKQAEAEAKTVECGKLNPGKNPAYKAVTDFCTYVGGKEVAIKSVMKAAQKEFKKVENCKGCHTETNGGPLNDDAADLWKEFLPLFNTAVTEYKTKNPAPAAK